MGRLRARFPSTGDGPLDVRRELGPSEDTMDRAVRIASLWNWLPTFRAVAEQEHVTRAAEQLGVSPSAVSRMVSLLEDDIGQPLFHRVGRSIQLNAAGRHLLGGVRSAMRMVDESLAVLADRQYVGAVRIACEEPMLRALVMPTLARLRRAHPALTPELRALGDVDVAAALLQGDLDVVFCRSSPSRDHVTVRRLGTLEGAVYAGPGHPLRDVATCGVTDVLGHGFVTVTGRPAGWPAAYRRQSVLAVADLDVAAEVAAAESLLVVLPTVVAARHRAAGRDLAPVPLRGVIPPVEYYAVCREQLELPGRAETVIDAVAEGFASVEGAVPATSKGDAPSSSAAAATVAEPPP